MKPEKSIGFDHSHENKLLIEDPGFTHLVEFLFDSEFKLGKIEAGLTHEKMKLYDIFIIGVPTSRAYLTDSEIDDLLSYIKEGGSLLIINDKGGDEGNKNNLNDLVLHFGVQFNPDELYDDVDFAKEPNRPIIKDFKRHFITRDVNKIIHSGGCTLKISEKIDDPELDIRPLAFSSENSAWHEIFLEDTWTDEPVSKVPVLAAGHYHLGKFTVIGNLSLFSSLHDTYGINAADNFKLISNMMAWLLNKAHSHEARTSQSIYLTTPIHQELFYWMKDMIDERKWNSVEEIINFGLRVVKIRSKNDVPELNDKEQKDY
jgi:hypothetical protein